MAGYFGTSAQQRLQMQAEAEAEFIHSTPGACQAGRFMGCDDPDRLGWTRIKGFIDRDGLCGFRLIPATRADDIRSRLETQDCRFDTWDVFLTDRTTALAACQEVLSRGLSAGLRELARPTQPGGEEVRQVQTLMGTSGIVPFSGSLLVGIHGPAVTVAIGDEGGNVVSAAHGYMPHNAHSVHHRYAWGGLVAVAESHRGKGIGTFINARMVVSVFQDLDATHIYELVSSSNVASRRMVEACGLRLEPDLVCGIATPNDSARFTR